VQRAETMAAIRLHRIVHLHDFDDASARFDL